MAIHRSIFVLFLAGMFLLLKQPVNAEMANLPFRRISPAGGFTLNPVIKISQDKQGFIWFITREKLYQYNSQDFLSFEPKYQPGISYTINYITSMLIDRTNAIWVGTNAGMAKFNGKSWRLDAVKLTDNELPDRPLFIADIKQNAKGEIWMIVNTTLAMLDTIRMELKFASTTQGRIGVNAFCIDPAGYIYTANNQGEMFAINTSTMDVVKLNVDISPTKISGIFLINNMLWISTDGYGLQRYTRDGRFVDSYFSKKDKSNFYSNRIREVLQTSDGKIWIATYKGLIAWHENNFTQYLSDFDNQFSLPDNSVVALMEDQQKGLWITTWRGGIAYLNSFANTFETYMHSPYENSLSGNLVNAIAEDAEGAIWIGTDGQGLDVFNEQRKNFNHIDLKGNKNTSVINIKCICHSKNGDTWIGTFSEGVFHKRKGDSDFKQFMLNDKNVYDLADDGKGLWIATFGSGLYYFSYQDGSIKQYVNQANDNTSLLSNNLRKLFLDQKNNLWVICTMGLMIKPAGQDQFKQLFIDEETSKGSTQVYTISGSKDGLVWLGTDHGVFSVDSGYKIRRYPMLYNGNPVSVYGIIFADKEMMWISSNFGIFSFDINTGKTLNYGMSDGLHGNLFNAGALCLTSLEKIYFGSTTGLVAFSPSHMKGNPYKPKVYFSRIFINHKEILPGQENSPLEKPLYDTEIIWMEPGQNSFSIEFVAQNYLNPQKNQFRYRLRGFDPNWIEAGSVSKATYTNIPPGKYVFEVLACNNDMVWNLEPATLTIAIARPLLQSRLAMVVYLLLIVAIGFMIRRFILFRTRLEHQIEIERLKRMEEEKSHQNKLNFFTNISHELRTPLTLITGPVESLMKSPGLDQGSYNQLTLIKRNAGRLLKLINQLLEFRRIEEEKIELHLIKTDIVHFVREIFDYFIDVARQKDINYVFISIHDHLPLSFDTEKIDKAVFNLLSNAFKFTPTGGTIQVEISNGQKLVEVKSNPGCVTIGELKTRQYIQISVEDNGPGMDKSVLEKVFDRFFRVENLENPNGGTGIGLHLTKHLILLHGGEIELESATGAGSRFRIRLPYGGEEELDSNTRQEVEVFQAPHPDHSENLDLAEVEVSEMTENWTNREKGIGKSEKLVLVVEDHHDLSNFICHILSEDYRTVTAFSGNEGIEKAQIYLPDLIISDVMMPEKNGIMLVQELKNNLKTSHIPIVLLTALTSVENKIEGYSSGADDYIEKPFNSEVLKARLKNIFASRVGLQQYYSKKLSLGFGQDTPDSPDHKMMLKAIRFVEGNLKDEKLDIEMLANHLNLSQSTLYRKLKALTGKSATDFIRTIRLEYAARLLKEGSHNIEEVSGLSGFNSHSYFTRSFKEHFGKTPTEYISMN
jgi:signal transduction histidine kinase/DNA-binding response OmpR family regulator/ligand-binding sensor domain-containing protein